MPRQHVRHSDTTYEYTEDFPEHFKWFQQESGLSRSDIARRLRTDQPPYGAGQRAGSDPTTCTGRRCWNWPMAWD